MDDRLLAITQHWALVGGASLAGVLFGVFAWQRKRSAQAAVASLKAALLLAQRAMAQSDRMLQAVVDLGQDCALMLDAGGTIRFATENLQRLYGLQVDAVLGSDIAALLHEQDRASMRATLAGMAAGQRSALRARLQNGAGDWRWVEATLHEQLADRHLAAVIVHLRDITDQMEAEVAIREGQDSLRRSEQHFRMLIESTSDMVVVLDEETRPLYLNPAASQTIGWSFTELRETRLLELVHPADRAAAEAALAKAAGGLTVEQRLNLRHKSGHYVLVQVRGRFTTDPEGRTVLVVSGHDITAQAAMEERQQQESKMEAIGRLAGGVAHDFNNLLTVIAGNAELAQSLSRSGDPAYEMLTEIGSAAEQASELTGQLLAFGRKKQAKLELVDLNKMLEGNLGFFKRILGANIRVTTEHDAALGLVNVDHSLLTQVLLNLVVNARDAMPQGGRLHISTGSAVFSQEDLKDHAERVAGRFVRLSVEDSGVGMDAELAKRIFEPYFTTRGKGNGLGLATVFGIVKQSGGFLEVLSSPGAGSTFHVYLPEVEGQESSGGQSEASEGTVTGATLRQGLVLVVDDEHAVRRVAVMGLQSAGYEILEAASGEEALAIWRQTRFHGRKVDLVLSDVVMPRMTGLQLAEQIAMEDGNQPVLLMSGFNEEFFADKQVVRPWRLLQKPFKQESMLVAIDQCLAKPKTF